MNKDLLNLPSGKGSFHKRQGSIGNSPLRVQFNQPEQTSGASFETPTGQFSSLFKEKNVAPGNKSVCNPTLFQISTNA